MPNLSLAFLSNSNESFCENEKVAEIKINNMIDDILFILSVLHITFWRLAQWRISELKTVNTPQKLMRGRMFN
jgi:hypothetical protein